MEVRKAKSRLRRCRESAARLTILPGTRFPSMEVDRVRIDTLGANPHDGRQSRTKGARGRSRGLGDGNAEKLRSACSPRRTLRRARPRGRPADERFRPAYEEAA